MSDKQAENTEEIVTVLGAKDTSYQTHKLPKMMSITQNLVAYLTSPDLLSQSQLKRLKEHKYSTEGSSLFEPPMQVFWRWLIEQVPKTTAPNTITTIGLACNIIGALILMLFCPTATEQVIS